MHSKLTLDWLRHYTLLHGTSYKTVPSPHCVPPRVSAHLSLCSFKGHNFVAACTDKFDTLVSCGNRFKKFLEDASYRSQVSYNVSSESTHHVCCRFLFKINQLFEMCIAFYVLLVSKEPKYQKSVFEISDTCRTISSICSFPLWESFVLHCNWTELNARTHSRLNWAVWLRRQMVQCTYYTSGDSTGSVCVMQRPFNLPWVWVWFSIGHSLYEIQFVLM